MTTLNTIIEEEKKAITNKYDLRYFDGSTYAVSEEFEKDFTAAMQRAYEAGQADWLRSEIEKVESAMKPEREYDDVPPSEAEWNSGYDYGNNTALTSIITRYKEELLELEKVV